MEDNVKDFILIFTSILWEAFPFVVLGALVAGILEEFVPQQAISKIVPKSRFLAVLLGGGLGLIFPMCECGIVPVMRRLLRKGLPLGTCIAYMLAGPIINVVVILSTAVAFGPHGIGLEMVLFRVGMGFVIACSTALIVEYSLFTKHGYDLLTSVAKPPQIAAHPVNGDNGLTHHGDVHPAESRAGERRPGWQRLGNVSETALHDFVDIMVFLTLGSLLAAFAKLQIDQNTIQEISTSMPALAILSMMGLAVLLCLCSEADAFVAASFTTLNPSAKLAFLVLGPMVDLKLLFMFTRVFRSRLIFTIVTSVVIQVFLLSMLAYFLWQWFDWPTSAMISGSAGETSVGSEGS